MTAAPAWFGDMQASRDADDLADPTPAGIALIRQLRARNRLFRTLPADQQDQVNAGRFVTIDDLDDLLAKIQVGEFTIGGQR